MNASTYSSTTTSNEVAVSHCGPLARTPSTGRLVFLASLVVMAVAAPGVARADSQIDFVIPTGHFYTQANGFPSQTSLRGYAITDQDDVPFWTEFNNLGGVGILGYPISQRLSYNGQVVQLTQRAAMTYDSDLRQVQLMDVLDFLSSAGRDGWLREKGIPPRIVAASLDLSPGTSQKPQSLLRLLDQSPPMKRFYEDNREVADMLGLPTSYPYVFDAYTAMRFQRGALQLWAVDTEWARSGDITIVNAGDLLKESGLLPEAPMAPEEPPETVVRRAMASSRGGVGTRGLASWYGSDFHGLEMRNGEAYDMHDPTTTASNTYPLGSWLLVTSVATRQSVEVKVTDTGAFRYPIVVDLSWAAFKKLANPAQGILEVMVEPIDTN